MAAIVMLIGGCQLTPPREAFLPHGVTMFPPTESASDLTLLQNVTIRTPGARTHHRLVFSSGPDNVHLVIFGPMGQRAATFGYNGRELTADERIPHQLPLPAADIITILQLVNWPAAALRRHLPSRHWTLVERNGERIIRSDRGFRAAVRYDGVEPPGDKSVYSAGEGYEIIIQSVRI